MPKLNNPGCGCCQPPCEETLCGDATTTEDIREVEWVIDLPDTFVWWFLTSSAYWLRVVGSGFANFNGTYIVTRTLDPCGWEYSESEYNIDYIIYRHEYDGVSIPGTGFQCPSIGYTSAQTIVRPVKGLAFVTDWISSPPLNFAGTPVYGSDFLQPAFSSWRQGANMLGPCEESSLTYNSLEQKIGTFIPTMQDWIDRFGTCSGQFVNYQGTATFTPTLA